MIIYFFKDRSKERVNFGQLIDEYFDKVQHSVYPTKQLSSSQKKEYYSQLFLQK